MSKNLYNPQRHHRRSLRLKGYDYTQAGAYFVTIVCQHRACLLETTPVRDTIRLWWDELPSKFPTIALDAFVIMPNHIHGIIFLNANTASSRTEQTDRSAPTASCIEHPTLGRVVQWFKTMSTNAYIRGVRQDNWKPFPGKLWQRNYYEHIIRNEKSLNRIRTYIENNPANWEIDPENPAVAS